MSNHGGKRPGAGMTREERIRIAEEKANKEWEKEKAEFEARYRKGLIAEGKQK